MSEEALCPHGRPTHQDCYACTPLSEGQAPEPVAQEPDRTPAGDRMPCPYDIRRACVLSDTHPAGMDAARAKAIEECAALIARRALEYHATRDERALLDDLHDAVLATKGAGS